MAIEIKNASEPPEDAGSCVEHVEGGGDEEAIYEEVWQVVNERTLEGWKLRGTEKVGDGVELLWDASDGRHRQG